MAKQKTFLPMEEPELRGELPELGLSDVSYGRRQVLTDVGEFSMARQEFADECDLNVLMSRYDKVGVWPLPPPGGQPEYLDLADVPDFRQAMDLMVSADRAFMSLPASVRKTFDNDPRLFVDFASDSANLPKMREWGLAPPTVPVEPFIPEKAPVEVPIVPKPD